MKIAHAYIKAFTVYYLTVYLTFKSIKIYLTSKYLVNNILDICHLSKRQKSSSVFNLTKTKFKK